VSTEIPRTLKRLWETESRAGRAGQAALTLDRIVAAAIGLADRDGLAALSMARLAQELGSAPMSLYRHVANKDELLVFMQDAAPGPPPELPAGWRAGLRAWARALRGVYFAHPWILQVTAGRPPLEPGQLAWLDRGLSAIADTPLTVHERFDSIMSLLDFVRGDAQIMSVVAADPPVDDAAYGELVALLVRPERFPALAAAVAHGIFVPDPADDGSRTFEYGLERFLDGFGMSIDR
jgi:AcrR family transcriptional regulator